VTTSFFTIRRDGGEEWLRPTDACRGPWDEDACHAGPPTGMLVRAAERLVPHQQFVRITVDLIRPVPHAGFRIAGEVVRGGRTVSTTLLTMIDADDRPVLTARTLHMAPQPVADLPTLDEPAPRLDDAEPGRFGFEEAHHDQPFITDFVETRYPPGHGPAGGHTIGWMRTVPLLDDEPTSGFASICTLADCGNAMSRNADPGPIAFLNTDLTVTLHREPVGEWFGTDVRSYWQPNGIGISDAQLLDVQGPVGRAVQSVIIQRTG